MQNFALIVAKTISDKNLIFVKYWRQGFNIAAILPACQCGLTDATVVKLADDWSASHLLLLAARAV